MKEIWKKRIVVAAVLVLVGGAVFLNYRYASDAKRVSKVLGDSTLVSAPGEETQEGENTPELTESSGYFATARLSRKQARDSAIELLHQAESDENAEETVQNEASEALQVLAAYTVAEAQIESLVTAKGYADCVAFMGEDSISVVVADADGLDKADVARIKDIVISETSYTTDQIKIMEAN